MSRARLLLPAALLALMVTASPVLAQGSYTGMAGSAAGAPDAGSLPPSISLGIAAASTVNDRPVGAYSSSYGMVSGAKTALAANIPPTAPRLKAAPR